MTVSPLISEKKVRQEVLKSPPCPGEYRNLSSLNIRLDRDAATFHLTEELLEARLRELENLRSGSSDAYWLTFARLTELALYCGGNYVDAAEFSAAGDLLVNPRLVRIHLRGSHQAVTKERHLPLSEQFREVADMSRGVIEWLKDNTVISVVKEPLLCFLSETLKGSGRFLQTYLEYVDGRMKQIADTLSFLAGESRSLLRYTRQPCVTERAFFESKLCRFELGHFLQLGRECRDLLEGETIVSRYLSPGDGRLDRPVHEAEYAGWKGPSI